MVWRRKKYGGRCFSGSKGEAPGTLDPVSLLVLLPLSSVKFTWSLAHFLPIAVLKNSLLF